MSEKVMFNQTAIEHVLIDLKDCADHCKNNLAVQSICAAVANLIAGAGVHGGIGQQRMMDVASRIGFSPEYYNDTIRVHYFKDPK